LKTKHNKSDYLGKAVIMILFIISGAGLLFSAYGLFSSLIEEISVNENIKKSYLYFLLFMVSVLTGLIVNKQYQIKIKKK